MTFGALELESVVTNTSSCDTKEHSDSSPMASGEKRTWTAKQICLHESVGSLSIHLSVENAEHHLKKKKLNCKGRNRTRTQATQKYRRSHYFPISSDLWPVNIDSTHSDYGMDAGTSHL